MDISLVQTIFIKNKQTTSRILHLLSSIQIKAIFGHRSVSEIIP